MSKGKVLSVIGLAGLVGVGVLIYGTLKAGGAFYEGQTNYDQSCKRAPGPAGAEDLIFDPASGFIFVSAHDRRADVALSAGPNNVRGGLYVLDPERLEHDFIELTARGGGSQTPADFRPHGLSLYEGPDGAKTLMVVSHPYGKQSTIEIFDVIAGSDEAVTVTLSWRKSISGPLLVSPNDVVALDRERFYATNDHGFSNAFGKMMEDYFRLNVGSVVYYDGDRFSKALGGLTYANGIEANGAGDEIYVAETTDNRVSAYAVDKASGDLSMTRTWDAGFGVDNIDVDTDGQLWVAGHLNMFDFITHSKDPDFPSPGKVITIDPASDAAPVDVFEEEGLVISGLSIGAAHKGLIAMGQVFDDGVLLCQ